MGSTSSSTASKGTRYIAPISPKAPRIYVTDGNSSVESQIRAAGGVVVRCSYSPEQSIRDLQSCDGLMITGGGDVNPAIYGQAEHKSVYGVGTGRDLRELALLGAARDLGLPVMGICRGLQIINVEAGGSLYQNIPDKVGHDDHAFSMMPVTTVPGSVVHRALGPNPDMLHLHHQSVRRLAKGFTVTARHADGIVEAIESVDGRVVGVQFHPESVLSSAEGHKGWRLFDAFVATCTRYRRRVTAQGRIYLPDPAKYVNVWPVAVEAHKNYWPATRTYYSGSVVGGKGGERNPKGSSAGKGAESSSALEARVGKSSGSLMLVKGGQTSVPDIVGWCGTCGIAFDDEQDKCDHMDWFHSWN